MCGGLFKHDSLPIIDDGLFIEAGRIMNLSRFKFRCVGLLFYTRLAFYKLTTHIIHKLPARLSIPILHYYSCGLRLILFCVALPQEKMMGSLTSNESFLFVLVALLAHPIIAALSTDSLTTVYDDWPFHSSILTFRVLGPTQISSHLWLVVFGQ